tara:strand:- start:26 stop:1354 length:1329 start_codon:yes stop_codon:yes gene_type:complete
LNIFNVGFLGSTVSAGFNPDSIANLYAWYDANDTSSITKDGSDRVSQWNDKKGSENLLQATGANQPLWISADKNGKDVISCTNVAYQMETSSAASTAQPQSFYCVYKLPANDGSTRRAISSENFGQQTWLASTADQHNMYAGSQVGFTDGGYSDTWRIVKYVFNGTSSVLAMNNLNKATGDTGTTAALGLEVANIGNPPQSIYGEILRYDSVLSATDDADLMAYLSEKWGISIPPTPDYSLDLSTTSGWIFADSAVIGVDTGNQRLDFNILRNGSNDKAYYDLGSSLSDSEWIIRFKCTMTAQDYTSGSNKIGLFGMSSTTGAALTAQDYLGLYKSSNNDNSSSVNDNATLGGNTGSALGKPAAGTVRYHELIRTSETGFTNTIYTDSSFTTVEATASMTIASTIENLRYFNITNYNAATGGTSNCAGYIQDVNIWNGISTL